MENDKEKGAETVSTTNVKKRDVSVSYKSGKKQSDGKQLIKLSQRIEVKVIKPFYNNRKGDKIKVHPITAERLAKKSLVEITK